MIRGVSTESSEIAAIGSICERTLRRNWREGVRRQDGIPFAYTRPSPEHYPFQWYWDSCFAAIVWRRFDAARARRELESLLAAQREDGFIGHTIFWDSPLNERQRLTYNVLTADATMTASIQPPALAWAWRIAVGDPAVVPGIVRHHDWLAAQRDLVGDGLLWIVQPDESGLDASPQFDAVWHGHADGLPGFLELVRRNRRSGYDLRRIVADGGPVCCEVLTNVLHGLSLLALGRPSVTKMIVERMYDEQAGLFRPIVWPRAEQEPAVTWAALSPLALPDLPQTIGKRLVEDHLLDPDRFWLPVPPPSVPATDPAFSLRESTLGVKRYWRGPTWINAAWLLWLGLVRLGYTDQAQELRARLGATVAAAGLREYYDSYTGAGMGASDFAWSSLVMEMLDPDPRAPTSYLGEDGVGRANPAAEPPVNPPAPSSANPPAAAQANPSAGSTRVFGHGSGGQGPAAERPAGLDAAHIRKGVARLLCFAVFVVAVIVTVPGLASIRTRLADGTPVWLALAACFRFMSALSYVVLFRAIFAPKLSPRLSYQIGMSEIGMNALVPTGGTSGLALGDWVLHRRGVDWGELVRHSAELFVFTSAFNVGAVAVLGWLGTIGVLSSPSPSIISAVPALGATLVIAVALCLVPRLAGLTARRDQQREHSWHRRLLDLAVTVGTGTQGAANHFRERDSRAIAAGVGYLVFDIATLWATLRAFHGGAALEPLGMGYLIGQLAGGIPVPGGLGAVEGGLIGALTLYGIPVTLATAGTLAYRAIALGIPILFGGLATITLARTIHLWDRQDAAKRELEPDPTGGNIAQSKAAPAQEH